MQVERLVSCNIHLQHCSTLSDSQSVTLRHEHGDGAGLGVGRAARVVPAVRLLHRGYHEPATRLPAVLACKHPGKSLLELSYHIEGSRART